MRIPFISSAKEPPVKAPNPVEPSAPGAGKGRPTPTRKEAEAARKNTLKVPADPKKARKAAKSRAAAERSVAREALVSGDEKHLPARDAGPVKADIRDFVDSRWCAAELFLPTAVVVLVIGFTRQPQIQLWVSYAWVVISIFILTDTVLLVFRLRRRLKERWPNEADRKGATFYALLRVMQIRRLRLPPPRFRSGGRPVKVKVKK